MKTAWRNLLAFGLVGALTATSCVIKTDSDGTGGNDTGGKASGGSATGGTGGSATTGGSKSTGGVSHTGGSSTTGGSKSTGGTTTTGGVATVIGCDNKGDKSTPKDTCEFRASDLADPELGACLTCISKQSTCCEPLKDCYATNPDNQCSAGGLDGESEYLCYQDCLVTKAKAAGGAYDPDLDTDACADACVTPACKPAPFGDATSVLVGCMHEKCETECFITPAM